MKQTVASILGDRLKIRTISVFTAGNLHSTGSQDIVSSSECAQAMNVAAEDFTSGKKQDWATNIIRNVTLTCSDSSSEKEHAFIAKQGNEKHLKIARNLALSSATLMLVAMILAGTRLLSNQASNQPLDWADEAEITSSVLSGSNISNPDLKNSDSNSTTDAFFSSLEKL